MPRKKARKRPPKKRVYFKLTAPEAKEIALVGGFNHWDPDARPLKQNKKGIWRTYLMLDSGTYEYRFLVDGRWQNNPDAQVVPNPYGTQNCVRVVP